MMKLPLSDFYCIIEPRKQNATNNAFSFVHAFKR